MTSTSASSTNSTPTFSRPSSSSAFSNVSNSSESTNGFASYSQPLSASTYKSVAPQIVINNGLKTRNVNSALTKHREASPSRWHVNTSNVNHNETPRGSSPVVDEQSRLLKFIGEEAADNANKTGTPTMEPKKLYGGAKIPSRVFKQLQTEFSDASDSSSSKSPSPYENSGDVGGDKPQLSAGLLRLLQSDQNKLQNDRSSNDGSCVSSSYGEMDEYYNNGMANTAARKESVLKELTTQFDPFTERRKPRAAPGKVFKYLQQQYDTPEDQIDSQHTNIHRHGSFDSNTTPVVTNMVTQPKPSRFNSPSFNFLQNQYKEDNQNSRVNNPTVRRLSSDKGSSVENPHDLTSLKITEEGDPVHSKPYIGQRIPGKTFRMLQENYANHPSVLQARK